MNASGPKRPNVGKPWIKPVLRRMDVLDTANGAKVGNALSWEGRLGEASYAQYMPFSATPGATP